MGDWVWGIWQVSALALQFFSKSKTVLKKLNVLKKKNLSTGDFAGMWLISFV